MSGTWSIEPDPSDRDRPFLGGWLRAGAAIGAIFGVALLIVDGAPAASRTAGALLLLPIAGVLSAAAVDALGPRPIITRGSIRRPDGSTLRAVALPLAARRLVAVLLLDAAGAGAGLGSSATRNGSGLLVAMGIVGAALGLAVSVRRSRGPFGIAVSSEGMLRRGVLSDVWFSWDDIVDVTADGTPHGLRTLAIRATSAQTGGLLRIIRRPPVRDRPPRWPLLVGGLALSASELAGLVGRCIGDSRVREAMGTSAGLAEVETVDRDPPWPLRNDVIWALGHLRRIALIGVGLVVIAVIGAPVVDGLWLHSGSSRATQTLVATTFACFMAPVIEMPESRLDFIQRLGVRRSALWAVAVLGWWIVAIGGAFLVAGALGFNG